VCWSQLMSNGLHYFGVRFVDLCDEERQRLDDFLHTTAEGRSLALR